MSDTLPSAPVAATVPSALETALTTSPAPAAPLVVPGQWRAVKPIDIGDIHYEPGTVVSDVPAAALHGLAIAFAIEPIRVDYSPPIKIEPEPEPVAAVIEQPQPISTAPIGTVVEPTVAPVPTPEAVS